jgi:hypothetical protein
MRPQQTKAASIEAFLTPEANKVPPPGEPGDGTLFKTDDLCSPPFLVATGRHCPRKFEIVRSFVELLLRLKKPC